MKVVVDKENCPATGNVRNRYGNIVTTNFDFPSKMVTRIELLNTKIGKMGIYGIKIGELVVVMIMIVLANAEV